MNLCRLGNILLAFGVGVAFLATNSLAGPSTVERPADGICIIRDDAGVFGGGATGMTHQRDADYEAKKILDLSTVPESEWQAATTARLSVYFSVLDRSDREASKVNGLDGAIEICVNGKSHRVANDAGLPIMIECRGLEESMQWHDFDIPKDELTRGPNEIILRPAPPPGKASDDYLYLGIDNTAPGGNSWVKLNGTEAWRQDRLNVPGGKGEYMVRLALLSKPQDFQVVWRAAEGKTEGPQGMLQYAGTQGDDARIEWDVRQIDRLSPMTIDVELADDREFVFDWLDAAGNPIAPPIKAKGPTFQTTLGPSQAAAPAGVRFAKELPLRTVAFKACRTYRPSLRQIDMTPRMAAPKGATVERSPSCRIDGNRVELSNGTLRCRFGTAGDRLRLESLYNELAAAEMIRQPDQCALFLLESGGKRFRGDRDFACRSIAPMTEAGRTGFTATLLSGDIGLEAVLAVWINDALRMGLKVTNRREQPSDFKLAFPHLAGLAISDQPADDYYFYPWGGGIIADSPAILRRGYGDQQAMYQLMDIFSPARGAGLAVACTDEDGRYKVLALRKHIPGQPETDGDAPSTPTAEEYKWTNSLPAVPGIGLTYEYLRRTRKPGEGFSAKDVAIFAHAGDWHAAMESYAEWCHRVWKFRPCPSRLASVNSMTCPGWGQDVLFRDGKYRTDFVQPGSDCLELFGWWEWSSLGPHNIPLDQVKAKLGEAKFKEWEPYFVKDPVTGQLACPNNPGDYDGYNERFGGLPALREAIKTYQNAGPLVTLYTDPMRVDYNTKCGRRWGELWGVVQPDGSHRDDYEQWRMCLDVADYRRFVAETIGRVMRETDVDGVRMDECGHGGSSCHSTTHQHTFAEPGTTEWMRAVAETSKIVRQAMDEAKPGSVLTTEFPGYDFMMQFLEGCITYDLSFHHMPLRPVECNLQRFYFPECKPYEIRFGPSDRTLRKQFWNAVGLFGECYPAAMDRVLRENGDVFSSRDCRPLIPTEARFVYVNRFAAGSKTVYTLYNATGRTLAGTVLRLQVSSGEHVFDLLRGREAELDVDKDGIARVKAFLSRNDVACMLQCPVELVVKRSAEGFDVEARRAAKSCQIVVCNRQGETLMSRPLTDGATRCELSELPKNAGLPAYVKLLDQGRLVDATALP